MSARQEQARKAMAARAPKDAPLKDPAPQQRRRNTYRKIERTHMMRTIEEPTVKTVKAGEEVDTHPAFALIAASRVSHSPPGAVLFDSEIKHQHYITVRVSLAERTRRLNHDSLFPRDTLVEVALSEAQWASFVSSMNTGTGVAATLLQREGEGLVPGLPYAPRLQHSMDEVRGAADRMLEEVRTAFEAVKDRPTKANIRNLEIKLGNATPNVEFAAKSLTEHAENVVQKARADIEAFVLDKAAQLGLEPGELGVVPQLGAGPPVDAAEE